MARTDKSVLKKSSSQQPRRFILFVVGDEPNSRLARQNMESLCKTIDAPIEWDLVDVLNDFQTALAHDVLATPALVQVEPPPRITILGNLNDMERVRHVLGLR